jgi:nucleoside-diphosphate-sugar epimerase
MTSCVAVTGGTGFVGRHVLTALRDGGHEIRSLSRSGAPETIAGITVIRGSLESEASVAELVRGASAVVHLAGAVRAADRAAYGAINAGGSARVAAAAASVPGRTFIQVSSLAARVPALSAYAGSKAEGEQVALRYAQRLPVVVVRPPAVYGPHDRATLPILRGLQRGWLIHPSVSSAAFSMLFAGDLARLIVALLANPPRSGTILEPDDGTPGGYGWPGLAGIAGQRLGRRVRTLGVPKPPLALFATLAERYANATGGTPLLWRGKVAELFHPDWVCEASGMAAVPGWQPTTRFGDGLTATLAWYREAGWI